MKREGESRECIYICSAEDRGREPKVRPVPLSRARTASRAAKTYAHSNIFGLFILLGSARARERATLCEAHLLPGTKVAAARLPLFSVRAKGIIGHVPVCCERWSRECAARAGGICLIYFMLLTLA